MVERWDIMLGKTHKAGAVALSLTLISAEVMYPVTDSPVKSGLFVAGAVIGSLMPDLDVKSSTASKKAGLLSFITRLFFEHRGTHSIFVLAIIGAILAIPAVLIPGGYGLPVLWGVILGYASHILLDICTKKGCPVFNPIKINVSILPLKTGGIVERIIRIVFIIIIIYSLISITNNYININSIIDIFKINI